MPLLPPQQQLLEFAPRENTPVVCLQEEQEKTALRRGKACLIYCRMSQISAAVLQDSDMDVCKQGGVKTTSNKKTKPKTSIRQYNEDGNPGAKSDHVGLPGFISGVGSLRPSRLIRLKPPDRTASAAGKERLCVRLGLRRRRRRSPIAAVSSFICSPSAEADE